MEATVSNQEFQLQEVLERAEKNKPDSPFFTDFEINELHSNPSRKESPNTPHHSSDTSGRGLDSKSSNYFTSLDSTVGDLEQRTQQLIDKINENRKQDHVFMNNCRESLLMKVSSLADKLEEKVFHVYDHNSKIIQDKLQELSDIMERIRQIETELKQVCHTVEKLYKDLCGQSEL
nr:synaptonemal complex central element protein 2 isoform X2 [Pogona vitticeps]